MANLSRSDRLEAAIWRGDTNEIYTMLVEDAGLFGKAFFGHKTDKATRKRLSYLWKRAKELAKPPASMPLGEAFVADPVADPETDCIKCGHLAHPNDICAETISPDQACPCAA